MCGVNFFSAQLGFSSPDPQPQLLAAASHSQQNYAPSLRPINPLSLLGKYLNRVFSLNQNQLTIKAG